MNIGGSISGALFSEDRKYRYALWRIWDSSLPALMFTGLNSSTAEAIKDDPTVIRMINFGKTLGFGGLYMSNLRAIVSAYPRILLIPAAMELLDGPNDHAIKKMVELTSIRVVGWGEWGQKLGTRPAEVLAILGSPVYCFKVNPSGEPRHPLYLPRNSKLIPYTRKS